jgi:hypothetical protein
MMITKIASWLNRTAQHGAMDIALQDTELSTYVDGRPCQLPNAARLASRSNVGYALRHSARQSSRRTGIGRSVAASLCLPFTASAVAAFV